MKAQEVISRYAAGERNFCNANLCGANLKGQDLSGADFSSADIRSANFSDAILHDVNFTGAQAGTQRWYSSIQMLPVTALMLIALSLQGLVGILATVFLEGGIGGVIALCTYLFLTVVIYVVIAFQGFKIQAFGSIALAVSVAGAFAVPIAGVFAGESAVLVSVAIAGAGTVSVAITIAIAALVAFTVAGAVIVLQTYIAWGDSVADVVSVAIQGTLSALYFITFPAGFAFYFVTFITVPASVTIAGTVSVAIAGAVSVAGLLFSCYIGWQVIKENEKFDILSTFGVALAALGGTTFCGADLTRATFSQGVLQSANFADSAQRQTTLTHVCWQGAKKINRARFGSSILQDRRVRLLLSTKEKGYKKDLTDANLQGANLSGITLEGATLRGANLSGALLSRAVLKDAILTKAQAVNADFTGACLTGATLEDWNIDSTTTLKSVDCQYIFLREMPDAKGNRERRPHNPDKLFQPGDFEKFFNEMSNDVQVLIRDGIDPAAFSTAFQSIMKQNPSIAHNAIKSVEKQGKDVLLTLQVPEGTDKAKVERDWDSDYQLGLKEGRTAAMLESAPKFEKLAFLLAEKDITTIQRTEVMTGNDQSQKISVQGDVTQSVVNLGDNNQISNQINQLGDTPDQAQLKDLLLQLKAAIESERTLSENEKAEALVEVGELAVAGQSPQEGAMKKAAKRSLNVIKGITLGLGETTNLATPAKELISAIALLFGL